MVQFYTFSSALSTLQATHNNIWVGLYSFSSRGQSALRLICGGVTPGAAHLLAAGWKQQDVYLYSVLW